MQDAQQQRGDKSSNARSRWGMEPNQEQGPKDQTESKDDIDWKKCYEKKPFGLKQSAKEYIDEKEYQKAKKQTNAEGSTAQR